MKSIPKALKALHRVFHSRPRTDVELPLKPVPASRPRVTRWGTYYGKNYTKFRDEAADLLKEAREGGAKGPLAVFMTLACPKPKTSQRLFPRGDNDNYEKAVWDSITKCPGFWEDDDQIIFNVTHKRFVEKNEEPSVTLAIYELEP